MTMTSLLVTQIHNRTDLRIGFNSDKGICPFPAELLPDGKDTVTQERILEYSRQSNGTIHVLVEDRPTGIDLEVSKLLHYARIVLWLKNVADGVHLLFVGALLEKKPDDYILRCKCLCCIRNPVWDRRQKIRNAWERIGVATILRTDQGTEVIAKYSNGVAANLKEHLSNIQINVTVVVPKKEPSASAASPLPIGTSVAVNPKEHVSNIQTNVAVVVPEEEPSASAASPLPIGNTSEQATAGTGKPLNTLEELAEHGTEIQRNVGLAVAKEEPITSVASPLPILGISGHRIEETDMNSNIDKKLMKHKARIEGNATVAVPKEQSSTSIASPSPILSTRDLMTEETDIAENLKKHGAKIQGKGVQATYKKLEWHRGNVQSNVSAVVSDDEPSNLPAPPQGSRTRLSRDRDLMFKRPQKMGSYAYGILFVLALAFCLVVSLFWR